MTRALLTSRFQAAATAVLVLALAGCASGGSDRQAWLREVRRLGLDPDEVIDPVTYSEEMAEVARAAAGEGSERERLHRLQELLTDGERFPFDYEPTATYGAEETFRLRRGNCVSFTSLFVALGRALGIPLQAALLARGEAEREEDVVVVNTHMVAALRRPDGLTIYDFARERDRPISGLMVIDDVWLSAVYLNNWGTEKLRRGEAQEAAADLELAIRLAPGFTAAYGNLGVARRRAGDPGGALDVYRRALEIDADNPTILNNLASLYRSLGRVAEASAALRAADLADATPFLLIARGDLERAQGHLRKARRFYRRAHRTAPDLPEPLVAIARLELERGRPRAARRALDRALERDPENAGAKRLEQRLLGQERRRGGGGGVGSAHVSGALPPPTRLAEV
jgi:tetratricopeptide (TPR) repeat protein